MSEHGVIFIVSEKGRLIVFPHIVQYLNPSIMDIHAAPKPEVSKSFDLYQQLRTPEFEFKLNGQNYLATYKPMPMFGSSDTWLIGIVVPDQDFVGVLKHTIYLFFLTGLIVIALGIFFVSRLATLLVEPLQALVKVTKSIKNFDLSSNIVIHSRIKEVIYLAKSLQDMKKSLRLFQKYAPTALVRQLIEAGEDARVGGSKKHVAFCYSHWYSYGGCHCWKCRFIGTLKLHCNWRCC